MKKTLLTAFVVTLLLAFSIPSFADIKFCSLKERILEGKRKSKECQKQFKEDRKSNIERNRRDREAQKKRMEKRKQR